MATNDCISSTSALTILTSSSRSLLVSSHFLLTFSQTKLLTARTVVAPTAHLLTYLRNVRCKTDLKRSHQYNLDVIPSQSLTFIYWINCPIVVINSGIATGLAMCF